MNSLVHNKISRVATAIQIGGIIPVRERGMLFQIYRGQVFGPEVQTKRNPQEWGQ